MTVTPTPNLGLLKPDATEVARQWSSDTEEPPVLDELAETNLKLIDDFAKTQTWFTWTPTIEEQNGTALNLDDTVATGRYRRLPGNLVMVWGKFDFAGSPSFGTSSLGFYFPLPVAIDTAGFHDFQGSTSGIVMGEAAMFGPTVATAQTGIVKPLEASRFRIHTEKFSGKTVYYIRHNQPFTWAAGNRLAFRAIYVGV